MKTRKLIILLLLVLASCSFQQSTKSDITGTEGLKITLAKLPTELFVGQGVEIPITLENIGASKVENGILVLSGYDDNVVHFNSVPKITGINLDGRSEFVSQGAKTTKIFTISSLTLPSAKENKQTFEVFACYQYKTAASPVVCINPMSQFEEEVVKGSCDFVDAQISSSQGAPIAITKVETWYFSDQKEVEFKIYAKDVSGKGIVLDKQSYDKFCLGTEQLTKENLDVVNFEVYMSGEKLICYSGTGEEQIDKFALSKADAPAIRCRAAINPKQPAYTTPISIYLSYGYISRSMFSIIIRNPSYTGK